MAKTKAPSVLDVLSDLKKGNIKPLYYFFGEDYFILQSAVKAVKEAASPFITSDFDKETIYGNDKTIHEVLDYASSFPFGSEKKLIILKEFEKVKDKKPLAGYSQSPVDFTVLVVVHNGSISSITSEPYKTLMQNGYLFEAKELKGKNLLSWLIKSVEAKGKTILSENAQVLIDMVGEDRNLIEAQLEKILIFMNDQTEITFDYIKDLSSRLKQHSIFDLQNAIGKKQKDKAIEVAFNLLNNGKEPVFIVAMLTKYFTGLSRVSELKKENVPLQQAARIVGTHHFYYKDYQQARAIYSDDEIRNAFRALLKADLSIKTTSMENKNLVTVLISEILS
ncbi:DNA polymerase III subunit delta [bacterium BMS3Abin03]|nr:DNA polymerase III subunit delta [bacterium BMS3Abin03]